MRTELGQSLSDFGKAVKILGACEGNGLGKAFSELGTKSEMISIKLQKEVCCLTEFQPLHSFVALLADKHMHAHACMFSLFVDGKIHIIM